MVSLNSLEMFIHDSLGLAPNNLVNLSSIAEDGFGLGGSTGD